MIYCRLYAFMLCHWFCAAVGSADGTAETVKPVDAMRIKTGGRVKSWEALSRRDYDITLVLLVMIVVVVVWFRAAYSHVTAKGTPDKNKTS
jgi:hypothetical protein